MYDYHTHSNFSEDASGTMDANIRAAIALGLDGIALTDHFDPEYPDPMYAMELDPVPYEKALDGIYSKYGEGISIVRSIELGIQTGASVQRCKDVVSSYDFDYVLCSVHSAYDAAIDTLAYTNGRNIAKCAIDYYLYMIECLKAYDNFDVLGHFNVIDRYVPEIPIENDYWDVADEALRLIASMGKGLEINTKSFRLWGSAHATPTPRMLTRFRELGGEIIVTGSDAHSPEEIGGFIREGEELARAAGFKYLTTYRERKPTFVKI